jgi:two-component system, cell cycle response regulator
VFLLTKFGHEALGLPEGTQGVEKARNERPDLILLDIHMPRMDGYEVARLIRDDPKCGGIPIVAVTALAMVGDREKILTSWFTGYISKPIEPETFSAQVQQYLGAASDVGTHSAVQIEQHDQPATPLPREKSAVVLVVDDLPANLNLLRIILGGSGYEVLMALSAKEGLDLGRQTKPDLIISDINMPHQDGYEFLRMVQADPVLCRVPFVFLSSLVLPQEERDRALVQGARKFISRPIEPEMLLEELKECIPKPTVSREAAKH